MPGELYIGGESVGQGYIHREALTREKFIPNPFSHGFLYKTGDVAKWSPRGVLEYLGRNDFQVKMHGYRIELGEIESFIARFEQVKETVVIVSEDKPNQKQLVAYLVFKNQELTQEKREGIFNEIKRQMQGQLPSYEIPTHWMSLKEIPLNINGKVERKLLPAPEQGNLSSGPVVAPRTKTEQQLAEIWCKLLNLSTVSTDANFFELGGSSISAVLMLSAIEETFSKKVLIREFLSSPTIQGIAAVLEGKVKLASLNDEKADKFMRDVKLLDSLPFSAQLAPPNPDPQNIFFTGASGFLGTYLLYELLEQHKTASIYCLIRAKNIEDGHKRLQDTLAERQLWQAHFRSRIIPVIGDINQPRFGLSEAEFTKLAKQIDMIIHNAAVINYIATYEMHRASNVLGTLTIIQLATQEKLKPIHFVSTTSVFDSLAFGPKTTVNESTELVLPEKLSGGYAQSKWVADRLMQAARDRGVPVTIYRPAGIAGDQKQKKGKDDFFHRFYSGIVEFGYIPDSKGYADMLPVDFLGKAIVLLALQKDVAGQNYHFNCPSPMQSLGFVAIMQNLGIKLQPVPYHEWQAKFAIFIKNQPKNPLYPISPLLLEERIDGITVHEMYAEPRIPKYDSQKTMQKLQSLGLSCPIMDPAFYQAYLGVIMQSERAEKGNSVPSSQINGYYPSKALGSQLAAVKDGPRVQQVGFRARL